eukprot:1161275-Pelagomonas_calceolata.AAC.2
MESLLWAFFLLSTAGWLLSLYMFIAKHALLQKGMHQTPVAHVPKSSHGAIKGTLLQPVREVSDKELSE